MESESVVRQMRKYYRYRGPFEERHGKQAQTLVKYASQHLFRTY